MKRRLREETRAGTEAIASTETLLHGAKNIIQITDTWMVALRSIVRTLKAGIGLVLFKGVPLEIAFCPFAALRSHSNAHVYCIHCAFPCTHTLPTNKNANFRGTLNKILTVAGAALVLHQSSRLPYTL